MLNTVNTGTAKNIPNAPKYAPPTGTANITSSGLIFNELLIIFGFIMFESICCKIVITIIIVIACVSPPVNNVIIPAIATAIIAPKYGIKLNKPIIKPRSTAYFTPNIDIAIDVIIPTLKKKGYKWVTVSKLINN